MLEFLGAIFNFLIRLLAALLCILFVATMVLIFVLVDVDLMLLSPSLYQNALEKEHFYERLPGLAAEQIYMQSHYSDSRPQSWQEGNLLQLTGPEGKDCARSILGESGYQAILNGSRPPSQAEQVRLQECGIGEASAGEGGMPPFLKSLSIDQWSYMLGSLLPPEWLQAQTKSALEQAFYIVETPGSPLKITLSLKQFKERLAGPVGVDVAMQLMKALPPCTSGQRPSASDPAQILQCRPPENQLKQSTPYIQAALSAIVADLPDDVDLLQPLRDSGVLYFDATNLPAGPRQLLQIGRWAVRLSPIICLALLLLIALLVVRTWKGLLRWWGLPIFFAGLASIVLALVTWIGLDAVISLGRESIPSSISPSLFDTAAAILVYVVHRVILVLAGEGLLLGIAGSGMVIVSFIIGRNPPRASETISAPPAPPEPPAPLPPPSPPEDAASRSGIFG